MYYCKALCGQLVTRMQVSVRTTVCVCVCVGSICVEGWWWVGEGVEVCVGGRGSGGTEMLSHLEQNIH